MLGCQSEVIFFHKGCCGHSCEIPPPTHTHTHSYQILADMEMTAMPTQRLWFFPQVNFVALMQLYWLQGLCCLACPQRFLHVMWPPRWGVTRFRTNLIFIWVSPFPRTVYGKLCWLLLSSFLIAQGQDTTFYTSILFRAVGSEWKTLTFQHYTLRSMTAIGVEPHA